MTKKIYIIATVLIATVISTTAVSLYFNEIKQVLGATPALSVTQGGTGTTTAPTTGQMLIGNASGKYSLIASSSLGGISSIGINGVNSSAFTFATGSDTNIGLNITTSTNTVTFTPTWSGTLDNSRIASSSHWNSAIYTELDPVFMAASTSLPYISSASSTLYVPYVGATTNVNLGSNGIAFGNATGTQILTTGAGIFGDTGGVYNYSMGAGAGTLGFNSLGYNAGVAGYGALMQLAPSTGLFTMFSESNVSAGSPHSHITTLQWDGTGLVTIPKLSLSGELLDSTGAIGSNGQILQSTGTSTLWIATSTLGLQPLLTAGTNIVISGTTILTTSTPTFASIKADSSAGLALLNNSGANVALFGAGGGQGVTFYNGGTFTGSLAVGNSAHGDSMLEVKASTADGSTGILHGYSSTTAEVFALNSDGDIDIVRNINSSGIVTSTSVNINGTAGAGYLTMVGQSSNPTSPAAGTLLLHAVTTNGITRMEQDNEMATNLVYGRDNVFYAKNTTVSTITKGSVVYVSGSTGNVPNIALAQANSTTTMPSVAVALDSINANAFGQVMLVGVILSFDTSAFTTGAPVWLSPTVAGGLTATRPSGTTNLVQRIGSVLVSGVGNGSLMVDIAPAVLNMETGTIQPTWTGNAIVGTSLGLGSGAITSGLINGQTISSAANFTGSMAIVGNVGIGTTSPSQLLTIGNNNNFTVSSAGAVNIANGSIGFTGGADVGLNTRTTLTQKTFRMAMYPYNNASTSFAMMLAVANPGSNVVNIGGGSGTLNAATAINLYTATGTENTTGIARLTVDTNGQTAVTATTDATSATTGSLITAGGLGVAKAVNIGTTLSAAGTSTLATSGGNVGIGIAAPLFKLDVSRIGTGAAAEKDIARFYSFDATGQQEGDILISGRGQNHYAWIGSSGRTSVPPLLGELGTTLSDLTTRNVAMTWDTNGNVGIGVANTALPARKLTVYNSNLASTSQIRMGYSDSFYWEMGRNDGNAGESGAFELASQNGVKLVVNSVNGNVGMGTTTPAHKLDVYGTVYSEQGNSGVPNFSGILSAAANTNIFFGQQLNAGGTGATSTALLRIDGRSAAPLAYFENAGSPKFNINYNGHTGIGMDTVDGQAMLQVSAGPVGVSANFAGNVNIATSSSMGDTLGVNGNIVLSPNPASNRYIYLKGTNTGTGRIVIQAGGGSATWGGTINVFESAHATRPGSVLFGSSVTGAKLVFNDDGFGLGTDVFTVDRSGNTYIKGSLSDSTNSAGTSGMVLQTTGTGTAWVATSSLGISGGSSQWTTSGSNIYYNTGLVSIGTTSAPDTLTINTATGKGLSIYDSGAGANPVAQLYDLNQGGRLYLQSTSTTLNVNLSALTKSWFNPATLTSGVLVIGGSTAFNNSVLTVKGASSNVILTVMSSSSAAFVTVKDDGSVGIGTTTPSAQFHTTGSVRMANFGAGTATFDASGNISSVSDERLKNIQGDYTAGLNEVLKLNPKIWKYNEKSGMDMVNDYAGFTAQNLRDNLPLSTGTSSDGYLTMQDRPVMAAMVNSIKDLQKEIDDLKNEKTASNMTFWQRILFILGY